MITRSCLNSVINSYQQYASINFESGTTYAFNSDDYGKLVVFNNVAGISVQIPQAIAPFDPWNAYAVNLGSGAVVITPQGGSLINNQSSFTLGGGQSIWIADGTNYQVAFQSYGTAPTSFRIRLSGSTIFMSTEILAALRRAAPLVGQHAVPETTVIIA